ncbi:hypothetical protein C8J57DRAFT_1337810, partial [Mycena rebaudengoi]
TTMAIFGTHRILLPGMRNNAILHRAYTPSTTANPALELAHPPLENGRNGLLGHDDATLRSEVLADADSTPKVADGSQDPLALSGAQMHDAYPGGLADADSLVAISSALVLRSQAYELGPGVAYMANGTLWRPPLRFWSFPWSPLVHGRRLAGTFAS